MNAPQSPAMVEVDVTYDELAKHLGHISANMLCRTVWKDGIDIEESCPGIKALVSHYATEAIAAERAEVVRLMGDLRASEEAQLELRAANFRLADECEKLVEILRSWKAAQDYTEQYSHLSEARDDISGAWESAMQARDAALATTTQGE